MSEPKHDHEGFERYETLIFVGHARLPENITAKHVFDVFGLEIEVDPRNNTIVDASCTAIPTLGEKFVLDLLVGHNLEDGIDDIIGRIERRYFGPAQRAIISALINAYERYQKFVEEKN
jgi:hypothetical protein